MDDTKIDPEYPLKEFFFWDSDGKNEANYNDDFVKYYYPWLGYQDALSNPKSWLVLWRKWTWKSLLAWYFHKTLDKEKNFSSIISYKDFQYHLLSQLENWDINPNQYISIWKFLLYLYLWKEILSDMSLQWLPEYSKLDNFISTNFTLNLDQNRILHSTINKNIKWEVLFTGWGISTSEAKTFWNYLNYLDQLEDIIWYLLRQSNNNFYLILDELDDRFRRNDENKDKIISLIKAVNHINTKLYTESKKPSKIITLLRTDIFTCLKDTDLNKVKVDNWITINWESKINIHSSLFKMLIHKIKQSKDIYIDEEHTKIFHMLFPHTINYIPPEKYLLERTFFRPRDVIAFINIIVNMYPYTKYIWFKAFKDAENEYSKYLLSEIENELIWHYTEGFIESVFRLIKQFWKNKFTYKEISTYFNTNKSRFKTHTIDEALEMLFEFWIIGNFWKFWEKHFHSSVIRDDRAIIDFEKDFVLHLWLRRSLLY
jgi:hypothetical protein